MQRGWGYCIAPSYVSICNKASNFDHTHQSIFVSRIFILQIVRIKFLTKVLYRPSVMLHSFFLCKRLQFLADLSVLMDTIRMFVVAEVAEPYLETVSLRLVSDRLAASPYVMPFQPPPRSTDEAFGGVLLYDAAHYSPHLAFISAIWSGVSV